jgi:hypothetical protein
MKEVFATIEAHLKAKVPALKLVTRWNNQLGNTDTEKLVRFPACFYQLVSIRSSTLGPGIQHCQGILRLRFADAAMAVDKLKTYDVEAEAYLALQNFNGGPLLSGLDRTGADPDDNFDTCEVLVVDYQIKYKDITKYVSKYVSRNPGPEIMIIE